MNIPPQKLSDAILKKALYGPFIMSLPRYFIPFVAKIYRVNRLGNSFRPGDVIVRVGLKKS